MKFKESIKVGDVVRNGYVVKHIVSKQRFLGDKFRTYNYLYVEKDAEKRILSFNPKTNETHGSFERHISSFGGSSKGSYKVWNDNDTKSDEIIEKEESYSRKCNVFYRTGL